MSCLIIKNDGIGDLILASGLIRSVGEHFGGNLDLLTCGDNQEIAEGMEPVRERFYVSRDGLGFLRRAEKYGFLIPSVPKEDKLVMQKLATSTYDTVICLRRFIRQSSLVIMKQVRAGKKFCAWEFPTNATRSSAERSTRGWEHFIDSENILSELSYNKSFLERVLDTQLVSQPHLSYCHKQKSQPATRRLALGIGGNSTNWTCGNWIELAMQLATDGWHLVLFGGNDASDLASHIMMKVPEAENHVGQLTWRNTSEILSDCEAYIGNDTGLSHLASLVVLKCLVILGGGTFRRFFPWPDAENQHIIFHGLNCFDCTWECKYQDRFCLSLVRPHNVMDYFHDVIEGKALPELDLNGTNEVYPRSWRWKKNTETVSICPPRH